VREDLGYDMARHVDSTVHMFDEWGLPMMKNPKTGRYQREGKWQIMIHGESYKPIVAEAAKKSADKIYNRIMITHLLMDETKENRVGGAVGFNMRTGDYYVFRAKTVIVAAGGGAGIAAVFSAPLGGFVYAIEELLNSARPVILLLVIITTFIADSSADIIQALGLDPKAGGFDFNLGFLIQKEYDPSVFFLPIDFIYLVLLGIIIGIFAELYSRYVLFMQNLGKKWYKNKFVLKMSICGLILGSIYSCLPSTFHNLDELQKIIAEQNTSIGIALLAVLVLFITTGLAAASGAPGGLFYPMLTLGGSIGLIMGSWVEIATGHAPSTYIFAGMGAFVAGCSRTPITAMFLAFALTKNLLIMKPVLISCIASFLVARAFNEESIYERQIQIELED